MSDSINNTAVDSSRMGCAMPVLSDTAPWWGRISLLWLMCVPIMVMMFSLCLGIVPHDFWWHARAGGIVANTGQVPTTNLFSSSLPPDTPYVYQSWLAEWLFYQILRYGGLAWIVFVRSLCISGAFALMIWVSYRRSLRILQAAQDSLQAISKGDTAIPLFQGEIHNSLARLVALGALITMILCAPNMEVRPQVFSVPLFALFIAALFEWPCLAGLASGNISHALLKPSKKTALITTIVVLIIAMGFWANLHGAFCTGLIILGVFLCGEIIYARGTIIASQPYTRTNIPKWGVPLSNSAIRAMGLLFVACVLIGLFNPQGVGVYRYVLKLAGDPPSQKYIAEWQSPTWGNIIHDVFFISPLLLMGMVFFLNKLNRRESNEVESNEVESGETIILSTKAWGRFGMRPAELLMLVATAVMTLRDVRSLIWYALLFMPIFCACSTQVLVHKRIMRLQQRVPTPAKPPSGKTIYIVNAVMALLLLLLIVPALPWVKPYIPLPNSFQDRFAPNPPGQFPHGFSHDPPLLLDRRTPVEAIIFMRQHPPQKRIFTEMGYGSYMIWMLYPQIKNSSDTRVELYPLQFWDDYFRLSNGPPNAAGELEAQGYSDALLDTTLQSGLIKRLRTAPGWKVIFRKGPSVILRRM